MKLLLTKFSSIIIHSFEKYFLTFAVLTFATNHASAEFGPQQIITTSATDVMDAFPADMDGDGDIDILAAKPGNPFFGGGAVVLYRNNGNGSFTELTPFTNGPTTLVSNIVASDLDNDGDLDVVLGSSGTRSGGVRVYRNNGSLRFTRTFDNENAPYLWDIHLGDVNNDNRTDIIFGLGGDFDQIGIYFNSGNLYNWGGLIPAKTGTGTGDEPRNIHLADIDGDGDQDIMSANYLSNQISYYPNGSIGGAGPSVVRLTSSSQTRGPRNVRTGDIDGDGILDFISTSVLDGKVAWYKGSGDGAFGSQKIIHTYSTRSSGGGVRHTRSKWPPEARRQPQRRRRAAQRARPAAHWTAQCPRPCRARLVPQPPPPSPTHTTSCAAWVRHCSPPPAPPLPPPDAPCRTHGTARSPRRRAGRARASEAPPSPRRSAP